MHGDNVTKPVINRQTEGDEGQTCEVDKNVTVEVKTPSSDKGSTEEHPPAGSVYTSRHATVNAKKIIGPSQSNEYRRRQKKLTAKNDVTVILKDRSKLRRSKE